MLLGLLEVSMSVSKTYLFYDLETSGLSKPFDQIQQFAGKRLDLEFNEIESRFIEARISPDIIPSPYAVITHQIDMKDDAGRLSEFHAAQMIHEMINTPNTISIGYNTLGFDDEFLRFAFYRNLLTPYTHQYANGCARFDVFPIAIFYYLYEKSVIKWPTLDGKPTMKLEHIVTENDWFQGRAHHAMNDVDATIKLATQLQSANPEMWTYLVGYFDKNTDHERIQALPMAFNEHIDLRYGLMVHSKFGAKNAYQGMLLALGNHNHYKNQTMWLRLDHAELESLDFNELSAQGQIIRKKYAEPGFLLPPTERYTHHLSLERMKIIAHNLEKIRKHFPDIEQLQRDAREFTYDAVETIDVDAGLYEFGFLTGDEQQFCRQFHIALPHSRQAMLDELRNPNLKSQAKRVLWREDLDEYFGNQHHEQVSYLKKIMKADAATEILDYRGEHKRGVYQAYQEVSAIQKDHVLDTDQQSVLDSYLDWLKTKVDRFNREIC